MSSDISAMLDRARESMNRALEALDTAQQRVIAKLAESETYDEKLGSHLAWVTAKVADITTSLRQLEKHDRAMSKTPEQRFKLVVEYIKHECDPDKRAQLKAVLDGVASGRRVLS